jgi:hypothetical protein
VKFNSVAIGFKPVAMKNVYAEQSLLSHEIIRILLKGRNSFYSVAIALRAIATYRYEISKLLGISPAAPPAIRQSLPFFYDRSF